MISLSFKVSEEMESRLNILAEATHRTRSFYLRDALDRTIDDLEDIYLAEQALERFHASGEKAIPLEEVERRLGLAD